MIYIYKTHITLHTSSLAMFRSKNGIGYGVYAVWCVYVCVCAFVRFARAIRSSTFIEWIQQLEARKGIERLVQFCTREKRFFISRKTNDRQSHSRSVRTRRYLLFMRKPPRRRRRKSTKKKNKIQCVFECDADGCMDGWRWFFAQNFEMGKNSISAYLSSTSTKMYYIRMFRRAFVVQKFDE